MFDLQGKNALVTGSSRGLGLILAKGLGKAGASVVVNGKNEKAVKEAVTELSNEGISVHGCAFDVSDRVQIGEGVSKIEKKVGPISILINNAGLNNRGPLESMEERLWREVIEVNLTGVFLVTQRVVKGMIYRQSGKIVNICSITSEVSRYSGGAYASAKGGLKMLTKAMAIDWAKYGIQVNGIGPGWFKTQLTQCFSEDPDFNDWLERRTPARRWGEPSELVGTAIFLSSRASDFITGQIIYVDGGLLAAM